MTSTTKETRNDLDSPGKSAYLELIETEAERLYGLVFTLLGNRVIAGDVITEAYRYVWQEIDRGLIVGDLEETFYRAALQNAIRRANRSHELRGNMPQTTANDR